MSTPMATFAPRKLSNPQSLKEPAKESSGYQVPNCSLEQFETQFYENLKAWSTMNLGSAMKTISDMSQDVLSPPQSRLDQKNQFSSSPFLATSAPQHSPSFLDTSFFVNARKILPGGSSSQQHQAENEIASTDVYDNLAFDPRAPASTNRRIVLVRGNETKRYEFITFAGCLNLAKNLNEQLKRKGTESDPSNQRTTDEPIDPFWLDFESPSVEQMKSLSTAFNFHPLTADDILSNNHSLSDGSQIEKSELFENYYFTSVHERKFKPGTNVEIVVSSNVLVFSHCVLSFRLCSLPPLFTEPPRTRQSLFLKDIAQTIPTEFSSSFCSILFRTCSYSKNPLRVHGPLWIAYSFLDVTSRGLKGLVGHLMREVEALDELVLMLDAEEQNDLLRRIGAARKRLTELRNELYTKERILTTILDLQTGENSKTYLKPNEFELSSGPAELTLGMGLTEIERMLTSSKSTRVYFRDVYDSISSMQQQLGTTNSLLDSLNNTYLSKVSIQTAEASNRMNVVMKKFSALATIFIPLTLVAGLFGMNVRVPGEDRDDKLPFYLICGMMTLMAFGLVACFRRWKWV